MTKFDIAKLHNRQLILILPASYIVEQLVFDILNANPLSKIKLYVNTIGATEKLKDFLSSFARRNPRTTIYFINGFSIKSILSNLNIMSKLYRNINISDDKYTIFVQSLEQPLSRLLLQAYINQVDRANRDIIGLQFSLPVFLFRDPEYVTNLFSDERLKTAILKSLDFPHKSVKKFVFYRWLKVESSKIIEMLFDMLFINKSFRLTRYIKATSYVNPGNLNLHLTNDDYYAYCIKDIYNEAIQVYNHQNINTVGRVSRKLVKKGRTLVILGPVKLSMVESYISDIGNLLSLGFSFNNVSIKPHPRFLFLSNMLLTELQETHDINCSRIDEIDHHDHTMVVLGYYSSIFDQLQKSFYNGHCMISEAATNDRYPNVQLGLLSGDVVGYKSANLVLKYNGVIE